MFGRFAQQVQGRLRLVSEQIMLLSPVISADEEREMEHKDREDGQFLGKPPPNACARTGSEASTAANTVYTSQSSIGDEPYAVDVNW
eukprot:UN07916